MRAGPAQIKATELNCETGVRAIFVFEARENLRNGGVNRRRECEPPFCVFEMGAFAVAGLFLHPASCIPAFCGSDSVAPRWEYKRDWADSKSHLHQKNGLQALDGHPALARSLHCLVQVLPHRKLSDVQESQGSKHLPHQENKLVAHKDTYAMPRAKIKSSRTADSVVNHGRGYHRRAWLFHVSSSKDLNTE